MPVTLISRAYSQVLKVQIAKRRHTRLSTIAKKNPFDWNSARKSLTTMYTKAILPALAAISVGLASAADDICSEPTITINSAADATQLANCDTVEGSVIISSNAGDSISIDGPESIDGDFTIADNGVLTSLTSSTISSIGGTFTMKNVTFITTLSLEKLTKVKTLDWQTLSRLETVSFSLSSADSVRISDTFLSTLDPISVTSVNTMQIDNNHRLTDWSSSLETLTGELIVTANGFGLEIDFPDLVWIANMTISNVSSISFPSLETVNGSMRFDSNFFESFSAPNMTTTATGDLSFTDNGSLKNISFPSLTSVGGGFTIANNTELEKIDDFDQLKTVGGAVLLRGNFTSVELPALNDVKGAFDLASTNDITSSCTTFNALGNKIQGTYSCVSNNENANDASSSGSGSSSSGSDSDNAASPVALSMPLVLGLAAFGIAQALV